MCDGREGGGRVGMCDGREGGGRVGMCDGREGGEWVCVCGMGGGRVGICVWEGGRERGRDLWWWVEIENVMEEVKHREKGREKG